MRRFALLLAATLAPSILPSAALASSPLPSTPVGRRAAAYFEAYNTGREEAMRAFIEANVAPEALVRRPVAERLSVYLDMRREHGDLTPLRLIEEDSDRIRVVARAERGPSLDLTFMFEPAPPHHLLSTRVMRTGPGDGGSPEDAAATPLPEPEAVRAWSAWLDSLARAGTFSGAVLLARGDSVLFRSAYGHASRSDGRLNRPDTRFNLGSINKLFTKLAIAQLVERGKIGLDDTIDRYLPDYPRAVAKRVTVRHLLEHRGGIGDVFGPAYMRADRSTLRSVADWIPFFRDKPLAFEPGTRSQYSNGGYVLLGAIVEKASGEDYYDYVRSHIYGPLGMTGTDHYATDAMPENLARGYTRDPASGPGGDWVDNTASRPMRGSPAGGGYSTVDDLLRFTRAIRAGTLLRPETLRDFPELGPGPGGGPALGAAGGAPGINAALELLGPYTIIALANLDPPAAGSAAARVRQWLPALPRGVERRIGGPRQGPGRGPR